MTDEQIIKALECCIESDCDNCPWHEQTACNEYMKQDALSLINRQKAEIERLTNTQRTDPNDFCGVLCDFAEECIAKAKADAIKEFAERLKDKHKHNTTSVVSLVTVFDNINTLVKEMVGDHDAD